MAPKTDVIEQLRERVRELEKENARLRFALADTEALELGTSERLAASQAYAEQLREALNAWIGIASNCSIESGCCCCGESMENHSSPMMCGHSPVDMADSVVRSAIQKTDEALSIPHDTGALDAYVAKCLHDMACDKGLLRIQVEELTRQRDLAVEALEKASDGIKAELSDNWTCNSYHPKLFAGEKAIDEALSAIKESENNKAS